MLRDRKFLLSLFVSILIIVLIGVFRPQEIDWTSSFSANDKIPYGTYVLHQLLPDIFGPKNVSTNTTPIYKLLHKTRLDSASLIFIQPSFTPTRKERNELLAFAQKGNTIFISSNHISKSLADTLNIIERNDFIQQTYNTVTRPDSGTQLEANFTNPALHSDSAYLFKKDFSSAFYSFNDSSADRPIDSPAVFSPFTVLGVDGKHRSTFIRIAYGKGYIFIHSNPYAFTNYYMLKPRGDEYVARCLSYLPHGEIIWDEFYKRGANESKTSLSFVLTRESLRWAYYTGVLFLILFILFNIKRRQRVIPVIDPFKNTSLEFTKTIGALYFNQSNHRNIARKKITYFLEFLRNRYGIDTALPDEEFARRLCYKSGMSEGAVSHLLSIIEGIAKKQLISATELIDLNHAIEYFKSNCQ